MSKITVLSGNIKYSVPYSCCSALCSIPTKKKKVLIFYTPWVLITIIFTVLILCSCNGASKHVHINDVFNN